MTLADLEKAAVKEAGFGVDLAEQAQGPLVLTGGKALCLVSHVCPSKR